MDTQKFITIWNASHGTKEVAKKTGLKRSGLSSKATALRNKGHKLKEMSPGNSRSRKDKPVIWIPKMPEITTAPSQISVMRVQSDPPSDRDRFIIRLEAVLTALKSL